MNAFRLCIATLILLLLPQQLAAYDFMVDGLCYNRNSDGTSVTVTYENSSSPRYSNLCGDIIIPETVTYSGTTYSVTTIGGGAFSGCSGLISVNIPNSVTTISGSAFYDCSGLTSVTIPNSVTTIGNYAFSGCSGLTSVNIGNSVTSIGNYAFSYCRGLTSVTIPNSVTSIGGWAFSHCNGLTSVTIPNSVTSIGAEAFSDCSGLTSVNISDLASWCQISFSSNNSNPLSCAHHLFLNGTEVKDLVIPNSVTTIGNRAFEGCSGLTSVTIPNSVTTIGNDAFYECI